MTMKESVNRIGYKRKAKKTRFKLIPSGKIMGTFYSDNDEDSLLFECNSTEINLRMPPDDKSWSDFDMVLSQKNTNFFPQNHSEIVLKDYNEKIVKKLEYVFTDGLFG